MAVRQKRTTSNPNLSMRLAVVRKLCFIVKLSSVFILLNNKMVAKIRKLMPKKKEKGDIERNKL